MLSAERRLQEECIFAENFFAREASELIEWITGVYDGMIGMVEVGDGHGDRGINWSNIDLGVLAAKDSELIECKYTVY